MAPPKKRPENFKKTYTQEELDYIEENAGTSTINIIASKLKRPISGVKKKMIELGCYDFHTEAGTYSSKGLAEVIGVAHETIRRWIRDKGLPAAKKGRHLGVDDRFRHYHIEPERFWKWAKENKDLVEFNKIPINALLPEPEWVMEERRKQFYRPAKQKIWTQTEDMWLLHYYYKDAMTQREIAERMGRTTKSIEKRLALLRKMKKAQ